MTAALAALGLVAFGSLGFTLWLGRALQARFPPVGHLVDLGPGRLHVVETAPQASARGAVLLVHGGSGNFADPHEALSARLAALGFHVFSVDRPGHGYSDRLGGRAAAAPRLQAAWIVQALRSLGVAEAIVAVHSLAGPLGLAMAHDEPGFVRGLVLLAPVTHPWNGGIYWYYRIGAHRWLGGPFRWLVAPLAGVFMLKAGVRSVFAPNPVPPDYIARTRLPLVFRPRHFRSNAEDFVALHAATAALAPSYPEIAVPTIILMGAQDGLVSAEIHARAAAREIPGATLRMLEGVGHSPHFSAPDEVIAAILALARGRKAQRETPSAAAG